jgi:hypothetical protein
VLLLHKNALFLRRVDGAAESEVTFPFAFPLKFWHTLILLFQQSAVVVILNNQELPPVHFPKPGFAGRVSLQLCRFGADAFTGDVWPTLVLRSADANADAVRSAHEQAAAGVRLGRGRSPGGCPGRRSTVDREVREIREIRGTRGELAALAGAAVTFCAMIGDVV